MSEKIKFFNTLTQNGWMPTRDKKYITEDTYKVFKFTLIGTTYSSMCLAHIAEIPQSIGVNGHLGVSWIEVEYEYNDRPYSYSDLQDMIMAINCAEKNLLAIGMPFQDNKNFHGTKEEIEEKIARNNELRKKWKLDEIEKMIWDEINGVQK